MRPIAALLPLLIACAGSAAPDESALEPDTGAEAPAPAVRADVEAVVAPETRVDLVLVIDRSGSMNGPRIEAAREAARAAVAQLPEDGAVALVPFDSQPLPGVALTRDREALERAIEGLRAAGGTDIHAALQAALRALGASDAGARHVLLLTDGQSAEDGILETVRAIRASGATVSAVGLGPDVNRRLLETIALEGAGRSYVVLDPTRLPAVFRRETVLAVGAAAP